MQAKNVKWLIFSSFLALLLTVAGMLALGGSAQASYPAAVSEQNAYQAGGAASKGASNAPSGFSGCVTYSEIESNSTMTEATFITSTVQAKIDGGITPAGDQDFYSFNAVAGNRMWAYVVTNQASPSTDSILTLLNASGTTMQLDDDNGFQSTLSSAIAGAPITSTGIHYLHVRQFGGATIMNPYNLYMNTTPSTALDESEPNDTPGTADPYTIGTVISGTIPITTDVDLYNFSLAADETIVIQVDGDPDRNGINLSRVDQFNPNMVLDNGPGGTFITVDSDSQGGNGGLLSENLIFTATVSSNFTLTVRADPSTPVDDDTGIYNLHIYRVNCPAGAGTATPTATETRTETPVPPSATATETRTETPVPPSATGTATSTETAVPSTSTSTSTGTVPTATSTNTAVASSTVAVATSTPIPTATVCTINFPDNQPGDTFYEYIQCLACRGVVTGYPDGMFHAERNITRGQISKVVSNAAGFNEDPGSQIYSDVPPGSTYYAYINRLTNRGIMSGYPCPTRPGGGGLGPDGDPCNPDDPAFFLPNANATRGQLAKIVSNAAGFSEAVSGQHYEDVPPAGQGSQFYEWIMRLTNRGVMGGYACGGQGDEPCVGPNDLPYFRWAHDVTRGQASKIVSNTFFPNCENPVLD